jgi:hypothetical protein
MGHMARSRRRSNEARRRAASIKQQPVPQAEQAARCEAKQAVQLSRYPVPPRYRYSYAEPKPTQPMCYWGWWDWKAIKGNAQPAA